MSDPDAAPTSEAGSNRENMNESGSDNDSQWRLLFEMQNQHMQALIQALKTPRVNNKLILPEFDPDKREIDARSWCATADLCFDGESVEGGQLVVTLSKSLKGSASSWLSQITYPGMTWSQFKDLFTARFVSVETSAATLINLNSEKPKDNETYAAYASRLITSLMNKWKNLSIEQIAVSTVMAHLAQIDTRLQRLAFTTEMETRHKLQQELQAFSYLKRKASVETRNEDENEKLSRFSPISLIKCYDCGKDGHKQADCRSKKSETKKPASVPATTNGAQRQQTSSSSLVCYNCGTPGHIASRCTAGQSTATKPSVEKRVDLCVVIPPSRTLKPFGKCFKFD